MENKFIISAVNPEILGKIHDGIIAENTYFSCELMGEDMDPDNLLSQLSQAQWETPESYPIDKNQQRAVSLLKSFKVNIEEGESIILGYNHVDLNYKEETKTVAFKNLKEEDLSNEKRIPQMSESEFKRLLKSSFGITEEIKEYPSKIIKVKNKKGGKKCKECDGTGKMTCPACHGFGKGECPDCKGTGAFYDCEPGKTGLFVSRFVHERRLEWGSPCPTCKGEGHFDCEICGRTGLINCNQCNGTGHPESDGKEQKVTELKESYSLMSFGKIFLPNQEEMHFSASCIKEYLDKAKEHIVWAEKNYQLSGIKDSEAYKEALSELNSIFEDVNIFGYNYVAYAVLHTSIISFTYDSEEYKIIILGNRAFANNLPQIGLMEKIFGSYKNKIQ